MALVLKGQGKQLLSIYSTKNGDYSCFNGFHSRCNNSFQVALLHCSIRNVFKSVASVVVILVMDNQNPTSPTCPCTAWLTAETAENGSIVFLDCGL